MVDRSKRYEKKSKGGSAAPAGTAEPKAEAEKTASGKGAPHPDKQPEKTPDPGPDEGKDATWGVVADRHKREHADMSKRHADAHASMVEAHAKEGKDMHVRHQKDMQEHMATAANKAEKTAGSPPTDTVKSKDEGKKGVEV